MSVIRINDLKIRTIIGTKPWERKNKQELIINIGLEYEASKACGSDQIKDAIDYETLVKAVSSAVKSSQYRLLEKLAAKVLAVIMVNKKVESAWVRLDKPQAIAEAASVSFEMSIQR